MVFIAQSKSRSMYATYEGPNLTNQNYWKLDVFECGLDRNHSILICIERKNEICLKSNHVFSYWIIIY